MRIMLCKQCSTLSKLPDFEGTPENDNILVDWIERHSHGLTLDADPGTPGAHPGGRMFAYDFSYVTPDVSPGPGGHAHENVQLEALEMAAVEEVRGELVKNQVWVQEYRDELRYDAGVCFNKHHQPEWPGTPCSSYQDDSKRLGRKNGPKKYRMFLCTFCPYESSVTVSKRFARGDYRPR